MITGRPTLDKKDRTLKLRLNDDMRTWIERKAYHNGVTMSEYIRILIKRDMFNR